MGDGKKKKKKERKRDVSPSSSDGEKKKKKRRHSGSEDERSSKKHKHKKHKKKHKKEKRRESTSDSDGGIVGPTVTKLPEVKKSEESGSSAANRVMKPMTKEEWEKQQSVIRRVYDPETGRNRLVKGDGEILEEIVSKDRQKEINKQATMSDGLSFQRAVGLLK